MSPRHGDSLFLFRQRKVSKKKATPLSATLRFAAGNLRCSLFAGSAQTRFAQTCAALIREKLRSSAHTEGSGSGLRFARPPTNSQPSPTHPTSTRHGAYLFNPLCACRGAQLQAEKGPRMFEPKASLRGPRLKRAPQVARSEAEGHAQWGRLSFAYFSLARQRKVSRLPGRHPGSGLGSAATYQSSATYDEAAARCPHPNPLPEGEGASHTPFRRESEQVTTPLRRERKKESDLAAPAAHTRSTRTPPRSTTPAPPPAARRPAAARDR